VGWEWELAGYPIVGGVRAWGPTGLGGGGEGDGDGQRDDGGGCDDGRWMRRRWEQPRLL